jgi:hypothetical protein
VPSGRAACQRFFSDLWDAGRFLRADDARRVGLSKGLGLPSPYAPGQNYVMTLLSALGTPIARRFEIWLPDALRGYLMLGSVDCAHNPAAAADYVDVHLGPGEGPIGSVWASGLPEVAATLVGDGSPIGVSARAAGLDALLAFPILEGGRCKAVVGLYF